MSETIKIRNQDHITILSINRPEVRNALSFEVVNRLDEIFSSLNDDEETRAVIIHGEGDKAFSAGADLKERQGFNEQETFNFVKQIQKTFQKLACLPMPSIAAINANAFGGGLELALACDIRVMSANAEVGLTECSLGIIPGAGGTQRLSRIIGYSRAMELIFSARRLNGAEAHALGLSSILASDSDDCKRLALKLGVDIANNAPLAVRAAKASITRVLLNEIKSGLVDELGCYHSILESADRKEGLRAFNEKRLPLFSGK